MTRSSFHENTGPNAHFHGQADHPSRGAEAVAVRSAASMVEQSLNSPTALEGAMSRFQDVVRTVQQEDPQFFPRLASKVNTEFQPQKYNMASSESLLAGITPKNS